MKGIYFLIIISFLVSCNPWFDMSQPEILEISPENMSQNIASRPTIYIDFSEDMDRPKTENSVTIESDSGSPKGFFRWDKNRLYYDLIEDLKNGGIYTITISKSAEDKNGNNVSEGYESRFYVGDDFQKPSVTSFSLLRDDGTGTIQSIPIIDGMNGAEKNDFLAVDFSEPVSLLSCEIGFNLSPSVIGTKRLVNNNTRLIFEPYTGLDNKTVYTIEITTDMEDVNSNSLLENQKVSFTVGTDFINPSLVDPDDVNAGVFSSFDGTDTILTFNNLNENVVEKNSELNIVFNEEMDRASTCDAISISPSVNYNLLWRSDNRGMTIQLTDNDIFLLDKTYSLTVKNTAKDISDNNLDNEYSCSFKINGEFSKAIFIERIVQMQCNSTGPIAELKDLSNTYEVIDLVSSGAFYNPPENPALEIFIFRVYFSNISDNLDQRGISVQSILNSISFEHDTYYGNDSNPAIPLPTIWKLDIPAGTPNAVDIYLFDIEPQNYYLIKIEGGTDGVKDRSNNGSDGNYLLENYKNFLMC